MRRVTLAVVFCLAACGGTDMVKQSPRVDARAARQSFLLGRAAHDVIASFAGTASSAAIDSCLNAWVEEVGPASPSEGPVSKPDVASLRGFLAQCLKGSVPNDLRAAPVGANGVLTHESTHPADAIRAGDVRSSDVR